MISRLIQAATGAAAPYLLLALALGLVGSHWWAYRAGKAAEEDRHARQATIDLAKAVNRAIAVAGDVVDIGAELAAALRTSREREERTVRQVEEIFDADPVATDFGALRRPAELERLRREQLKAIGGSTEADQLRR